MSMLDGLGYFAATLVLGTFCTRTMTTLRSLAIASNTAFIAYGAAAHLWPILVLHAIMLPLNIQRLREARRPATAVAAPAAATPPLPVGVGVWNSERDRRITAAHAHRRIASHRRTAFCSGRRDPMIASSAYAPPPPPHHRGVGGVGWVPVERGRAAECGFSMPS